MFLNIALKIRMCQRGSVVLCLVYSEQELQFLGMEFGWMGVTKAQSRPHCFLYPTNTCHFETLGFML